MSIDEKNYKSFAIFTLFLIGLSVWVAYEISLFFTHNSIEVPFYLDLPISAPAIYGVFFYLFNNYLWELPLFRWFGLIKAENLAGKWNGFLKSSYDKFATDIPAELIITQTATSVKIRGKFNESRSCSVHESFGIDELCGVTALFFFYRNEPNYDATSTMSIHEGSMKLIYNKEDDSLSGYYYSGRDRNNHGIIKVYRKGK